MNQSEPGGCSGAGCQCGSPSVAEWPTQAVVVARVNGVALHAADEQPDVETLRERACAELLRQRAVNLGLLPGQQFDIAPEVGPQQQEVIESMLEREVVVPEASDEACQRHYAANKAHYVVDQATHLRHILFAVTPGVNVQKLAQRAEAALLELTHKDAGPGRFEQLARELSNCPSSAQGGDLGWIGPHDCAPELAQALFFQSEVGFGLGVHPRLVHTRYGLHIIEMLEQRKGRQLEFDAVRDSIAAQLSLQSRATALRQYMMLLVGQADIVGVALEGADTPLVQ
jgi:peptidyl-prolyl cis-trans isomerase C